MLTEQVCQVAFYEGLTSLTAITLMMVKRAEQALRTHADNASSAVATPMPMLTQQHDLIRGAQDYAAPFAMAARADAGYLQ